MVSVAGATIERTFLASLRPAQIIALLKKMAALDPATSTWPSMQLERVRIEADGVTTEDDAIEDAIARLDRLGSKKPKMVHFAWTSEGVSYTTAQTAKIIVRISGWTSAIWITNPQDEAAARGMAELVMQTINSVKGSHGDGAAVVSEHSPAASSGSLAKPSSRFHAPLWAYFLLPLFAGLIILAITKWIG